MSQGDSAKLVGIPVLLLTMLVGYGRWTASETLRTARQQGAADAAAVAAPKGSVNARLWQDPVAAVRARPKTSETKESKESREESATTKATDVDTAKTTTTISETKAAKETRETRELKGPDPLLPTPRDPADLVLLVCTSGGGYQEDSERRLRDRYAAVTGLAQMGFMPDDPEHILWREVLYSPHPDAGPLDPATLRKAVVPYETFHRDGAAPGSPSRVLLCWLNDADFSGASLAEGVRAVLDTMRKQCDFRITKAPNQQKRIAVIGPTFSDDLIELYQTVAGEDAPRIQRLRGVESAAGGVVWYSPSATISWPQIRKSLGTAPNQALITRTLCADDVMAQALVHELYLRRALTTNRDAPFNMLRKRRVVVISELDTSYSRGISDEFDAAMHAGLEVTERPNPRSTGPDALERAEALATHIDHYTVLRGVDGVVSNESGGSGGADGDKSKDRNKAEISMPLRAADRPSGRPQFDYLRRLAERIREDELATIDTKGAVAAIGIFGTDVYDKLLVLQAFRATFPGIVFFTTDLDSRLLMPDQNAWARNLVVASSYGLQLGPELQGKTPPFRDVYQTSLYRTVLQACATAGCSPPAQAGFPDDPSVHVYEVGRTGAWDLSAVAGNDPAASASYPPRVSPVWQRWVLESRMSLAAAFLAALFLGLVIANVWMPPVGSPAATQWSRPLTWPAHALFGSRSDVVRTWSWTLLLLGLICASVWCLERLVHAHRSSTGGEPCDWFEGISVWPTELIRAALCAVVLLRAVLLVRDWRRGTREIERAYKLRRFSAPQSRAMGLSRFFVAGWHYRPAPAQAVLADQLWGEYVERSRTTPRVLRVFVFAVLYAGFCLTLFSGLRMPPRPARGDWSFDWDLALVIASTSIAAFLTLLVWDAVRLCDRFTRFLTSEKATKYSRTTLATVRDHEGWEAALAPHWLDIKLIGLRTGSVSRAMYYPLAALFVLVVARSTLFDDWHWGAPLFAAWGANAAVMLFAGWLLRRTAVNARDVVLGVLRKRAAHLDHLRDRARQANRARLLRQTVRRAARTRELITVIKDTREGTFAAWKDHPLLGSLLLPSGGAIALWAVDLISKAIGQ